MRILAVLAIAALVPGGAFAGAISDKARSSATEIVLNCPPHSIGGKDEPTYWPCDQAIERWRLLSAADRSSELDQWIETMASARQEAEESLVVLAKPKLDRDTFDRSMNSGVAASKRWDAAVGSIRDALRR